VGMTKGMVGDTVEGMVEVGGGGMRDMVGTVVGGMGGTTGGGKRA